MSGSQTTRRTFLKQTSVAALTAGTMPYWFTSKSAMGAAFRSPNDRPVIGCIGVGDRWQDVGRRAMEFGNCVAVCDVDADHVERAKQVVIEKQGKKGKDLDIEMHEDYRKILDRKDIEAVTIVTPDHWHSKIAIEAMKAGKDVYCEKPLTLTIDEGKKIIEVLDQTKRVFQVGTQQRSEFNMNFLKAIAMIRDGRIGEVTKVQCAIGTAPTSQVLPKVDIPKGLNWEMWLGQAPLVDYISGPAKEKGYPESRCHYEFRWWYEYSGGKMTDWGAHHVDVAQWGMGMDHTGPISVEGTAEHPVTMKNGMPVETDRYNVASKFHITCKFANGMELVIRDDTDNGVLFEGTEGRFFVSRGKMSGKPVEDLESKPLPEDALVKAYKGKELGEEYPRHMRNFFECIVDRSLPASDVYTHHRAMTTCHLANIAIRLGRKIQWDPEKQEIVGDPEAALWVAREQRKGYEVTT